MDLTWGIHKTQKISAVMTKMAFKGRWDIFYDTHLKKRGMQSNANANMFDVLQEDLIICEYCDEGVHFTCLSPRPEKRPKVWDCDDCLIARGKHPNNNVKKRSGAPAHPVLTYMHAPGTPHAPPQTSFITHGNKVLIHCCPNRIHRLTKLLE